ncbi:hypothetical protein C3K47_04180 [Solitalea longa]|uniref:Peptidase M60 domain-containing protein n=1 Tax=Solitalea longa TaxID=2079460 RepID=A0A2S5A7L9_9SPHI|nr:M60 family metallopeptidase [Solitalea longa]POY38600.1 hypothetical protein C3K47_04180 [Solitalea longa]
MNRSVKYILYSTILGTLLLSACGKEKGIEPNKPDTPSLGFKIDSVLTVTEMPAAEMERIRLGVQFPHTDFEPTGFYLPPNGTVKLNVKQVTGTNLPKLMIGTYSRYLASGIYGGGSSDIPEVQLKEGENIISDTKGNGGLLYIRYSSFAPNSTAKVSFISGFKPVPFYVKGKTTHAEWLKMLSTLNNVPDVQLVGGSVIVVSSLAKAIEYKNEDQDAVLTKLDQMRQLENAISGLDGSSPENEPSPLRILMTQHDDPNAFMYAFLYRTAFAAAEMDKILTVKGVGTDGWGPWHEIGHLHQQHAWRWSALGEVTVNIYSLAVQRSFTPGENRLVAEKSWNLAATYLALPEADKDFNAYTNGKDALGNDIYVAKSPLKDVFARLCMFEQLRKAYGDKFYPDLHKWFRKYKVGMRDDDDRIKYFMMAACKVSGKDLTDFFKKWGLKCSTPSRTDDAYRVITELYLPKADDITTLRD